MHSQVLPHPVFERAISEILSDQHKAWRHNALAAESLNTAAGVVNST